MCFFLIENGCLNCLNIVRVKYHLKLKINYFHWISPLGRFGLVVAMSVCLSVRLSVCVCLMSSPSVFFLRPLIGPHSTWSIWGLSLVNLSFFPTVLLPSGPMLSIIRFVRPSVRLCVCLFTFGVPFKRLFAPPSWNRMSNIFRDSESLRKSSG